MECVLCKNSSVDLLCEINVVNLCNVYRRIIMQDIANEFNGMNSIKYVKCPNCDLRFFSPVVTGSYKFYDLLSQKMGVNYYQYEKNEYKFAGSFINENDSVLDVGSGCGTFKKYVKGQYVGLDFNPSAIEQAKKEKIRVINESVENHVFNISSLYSVVTAFQVLEHMADPRKFLQACLDALTPGGLLIISVPSEESFVALQENAVLNMPPHHVSRWTDRSLYSLENIFDITLVCMEHDMLEKIHVETYLSLLANITIRTLLKWNKVEMVDVSLKKRIVDKLSSYLMPLYRNVFNSSSLWPKGHSVTVIYKKHK